MKHYPYIQEKKPIINFICENCKRQVAKGFRLEWRVDIFQGNCEFENTCIPCRKKAEKEEKIRAEEKAKRDMIEFEREEKFWEGMKARLEANYQVKYLTPHQWRINGVLDIYPGSRRYHDIKKNQRGSYQDMFQFLQEILI